MIDSFPHYLSQEDPDCVYLPSRKEIRTQCEEIRSHWTDREYQKRSHLKPERWSAPTVYICMDHTSLSDES